MTEGVDERPWADDEREAHARELFTFGTLSPEEYAAREGHRWACFSFDDFKYRDPSLDVWIQRLGRILFTPGMLEQCRRQFLRADELARIEAESEGEF